MERTMYYETTYNELFKCQKQLANYKRKLELAAHKNAHELRAPLARLKGLFYLYNSDPDPLQRDSVLELLNAAIFDLDEEVQKISGYLDECCGES